MSAFTDLLEDINARRLYLVTVKPYAFTRGSITAVASGNKFTSNGLFRGIQKGDVLQTKGTTSDNNGTITVISATDNEIVVSGLTLINQSSHLRTLEGIVIRYYSTDGFVTEPSDTPANVWYDARVEVALQFTRSMYNGSSIGGQSIPGFGQITINNLDGAMDAYRSWGWAGRRITVEMGGEGFSRSEYGIIFDGLTSGIELSDEFFTISVRDLQALLDQDIWVPTYLGTGGIEGNVDLLGSYKPLTVGRVRNVQPTPIGIVNGRFTYQYTDGVVDTYDPGLNIMFTHPTETLDSRLTFARSSVATRFNSSGNLETVGNNIPRFDYQYNSNTGEYEPAGILIEAASTNLTVNNTTVGAAVGTPGTLPTGWSGGTGGSINRQVTGLGTEDGIPYIDIRFYGTNVSAGAQYVDMVLGTGTVTVGQTWTQSVYLRLTAGNTTGLSGLPSLILYGIPNFSDNATVSVSSVNNNPLKLQRFSATRTFVNGTTTSASNRFSFTVAIGATIDFTLRFALPQFEQRASASSPILTSGVSASRSADLLSSSLSLFPFNNSSGTVIAEFRTSFLDSRILQFIGTTDNRIELLIDSGNVTTPIVVTSGIPQTAFNMGTNSSVSKVGLTWELNNFAACRNGGTVQTDISGTIPTVTTLNIGNNNGSSNFLNGWIRSMNYYPRRISNLDLQSITAQNYITDVSSVYDQGIPLIYSSIAPAPGGSVGYNLTSAQYTFTENSGLVIVGGSEPAYLTMDTYSPVENANFSVSRIMEYLVKNRLRLDSASSNTSLTVGTGTKVLYVLETFPVMTSSKILVSLRDDPDNVWMYGTVTSFVSGTLTINVSRKAGSGTFEDWVITKIGLMDSEIVTNTFSNLHTINPSISGLSIPSGGNALQILDELSQSIGAYYGFNREGKFQVGRLEAPVGVPNLTLTGEEVLELTRENTRAPLWRIQLGFNKNWSVMSGTNLANAVRSNIVTNGTFDTATGWVFGTGWSFSNFTAVATSGTSSNLSRAINLVMGQTYTLRVEITRSSGSIQPKLDSLNLGPSIVSSGVYEIDFKADSTTGSLIFTKDSSFAGVVDNVTIVSKNLKFLSNEYRTVTSADTSIRSVYGPNSTSEVINTFLDKELDAQNEADRQLILFGTFRDVFKIEAKTQAFAVDINSLVQLTDYRWGLDNGRLFRVIEISEDASDNRTTLTLWG